MCTASTAKRKRRNARLDPRYQPKGAETAEARRRRMERERRKALIAGRSFGYSKKKGGAH